MDFVEDLFTLGGASVVYGPSNAGKTFWIVDLGVAVASGRPFRDEMEVDQGAVIYVALEGSHGAKNRIEALRRSGKLEPGIPFYLVFDPVSLLEPGHAERLAETVAKVAAESGHTVALVIIDTMARAMAGGDENKGEDMTLAVQAIDAVRAATGAHVCVVHHCGKDQARGARGHSSLRAAVDTEIEITKLDSGMMSVAKITKQRDLAPCDEMPFFLKVVELGTDRRGKPITSCVVCHESPSLIEKPSGSAGRKKKLSVDDVVKALSTGDMARTDLIDLLMDKHECTDKTVTKAIVAARIAARIGECKRRPADGGRALLWYCVRHPDDSDSGKGKE
ncbi:MAG: AAA family ATPase [Verrucomicrobiae bacterium]|nr:AAA family ATPase [Verrucomicrobiae bacterium]MCP5532273.1 AAA family ATPase [Akkermansiaceae bacterium]MCP5542956.1 AAA family ATPase [Akkermansiaceae bacterium]MCP5547751.1 AAA family ATPase [Akkermansiaceae bacterium]